MTGMARTCNLSASLKRSSRSVCVTNRSALVCKRTLRRFGNGQVSKERSLVSSSPPSESDATHSFGRLVAFSREGPGTRPGITNTNMARYVTIRRKVRIGSHEVPKSTPRGGRWPARAALSRRSRGSLF